MSFFKKLFGKPSTGTPESPAGHDSPASLPLVDLAAADAPQLEQYDFPGAYAGRFDGVDDAKGGDAPPPGDVENHPDFIWDPQEPEAAAGDTSTHEVGHWMGLHHTFDDGSAGPGSLAGVDQESAAGDGSGTNNANFATPSEDIPPIADSRPGVGILKSSDGGQTWQTSEDPVSDWSTQHEFVSGKRAQADYNFQTPSSGAEPPDEGTQPDAPTSGLAADAPDPEAMDGAILVVSAADGPMPGGGEAPADELSDATPSQEAPSFFDGRLLSAQDLSDEQKPGGEDSKGLWQVNAEPHAEVRPGVFKTAGGLGSDGDAVDYREGGPPSGATGAILAGNFNFNESDPAAGTEDVEVSPGTPQASGDDVPTEEVAFYYNKIGPVSDAALDVIAAEPPAGPDAAGDWDQWFDDFAIKGNNGTDLEDDPSVPEPVEHPNVSFYVPEVEPAPEAPSHLDGRLLSAQDLTDEQPLDSGGPAGGGPHVRVFDGSSNAPTDPAQSPGLDNLNQWRTNFGQSAAAADSGDSGADVLAQVSPLETGAGKVEFEWKVEEGESAPAEPGLSAPTGGPQPAGFMYFKDSSVVGEAEDAGPDLAAATPDAPTPISPYPTFQGGVRVAAGDLDAAPPPGSMSQREQDVPDDGPSTLADLSRDPPLPAPIDPPPFSDGDFQDDDLPSL